MYTICLLGCTFAGLPLLERCAVRQLVVGEREKPSLVVVGGGMLVGRPVGAVGCNQRVTG